MEGTRIPAASLKGVARHGIAQGIPVLIFHTQTLNCKPIELHKPHCVLVGCARFLLRCACAFPFRDSGTPTTAEMLRCGRFLVWGLRVWAFRAALACCNRDLGFGTKIAATGLARQKGRCRPQLTGVDSFPAKCLGVRKGKRFEQRLFPEFHFKTGFGSTRFLRVISMWDISLRLRQKVQAP